MVKLSAFCALLFVGASFATSPTLRTTRAAPLNAAVERRVRVRCSHLTSTSRGRKNANWNHRRRRSRGTSWRKGTPTPRSSTQHTTSPCPSTTSSTTASTSHTSTAASIYVTGSTHNFTKLGGQSSFYNPGKQAARTVWGFCRRDCCINWRSIRMESRLCLSIDTMAPVSRFRISRRRICGF